MTLALPTASVRTLSPVALRRAALALVCAGAAAGAYIAGDPSARLAADPDLATLLRGMAALKALIALAAAAAIWWRLALPISAGAASAYVAGAGVLVAGAVSIWQLSFIGAVAIGFHAALLGLALLALKR